MAAIYRGCVRCSPHNLIHQVPFLLKPRTLTKVFCHVEKTMTAKVVDALDDFTSQLINTKIKKWNAQSTKKQNCGHSLHVEVPNWHNIKSLGTNKILMAFQYALDTNDKEHLKSILYACMDSKIALPDNLMLNVLTFLSQHGEKECILMMQKECQECNPDLLKFNSNFDHYIAAATWIKGDVMKALEIFDNVYKGNIYCRRHIRLMLKWLIKNLISHKSEVILLKVLEFSEQLSSEYKDHFPLSCVWQTCFLSEWFSDQNIAIELLDNNKNLLAFVSNRIPYVVFVSLKCHRTEVVYRLLEILLKYEMKADYCNVLLSLLDYQFHCRDFKSCSEIILWANQKGVELPANFKLNMITILINQNYIVSNESKARRPNYLRNNKPDFKF